MSQIKELAERLSGFKTEEEYSVWILGILTAIWSRNMYYPDIHVIKDYETPYHGLEAAYCELRDNDSKALFRKAIGRTLEKCAKIGNEIAFPVVESLMYLMIMIDATEALDDLLALASSELVEKNKDQFFWVCITVAGSLEREDKVFQFTLNLIDSPFFDDGYIFAAIKIMAKCRPDDRDRIYKIIDELKPRIKQLYAKCKKSNEEAISQQMISFMFAKRHPDILERVQYLLKEPI